MSDEHPPDATGLTIDWVGVQATGSGPVSAVEVFVVGGLAALRALPFVAWGAALRHAPRAGGRRRVRVRDARLARLTRRSR